MTKWRLFQATQVKAEGTARGHLGSFLCGDHFVCSPLAPHRACLISLAGVSGRLILGLVGANDPMTSWWWFEVTTGSALGQQMVSWAPFHPEPPCLQNCVAHLKLDRNNILILVIYVEFFNDILSRVKQFRTRMEWSLGRGTPFLENW